MNYFIKILHPRIFIIVYEMSLEKKRLFNSKNKKCRFKKERKIKKNLNQNIKLKIFILNP